jgi:serine/threonine protein kinase/tetratricopeptide (TPR) repeat protein
MDTRPILGRFRVEEEIGRGAMGTVHRGVHVASGVPVAVKVIGVEHAGVATFRAAFRDEVRAVAALDHPGIVMVFDQGVVDDGAAARSRGRFAANAPYFVMEHVAHGTLADVRDAVTWAWLRGVVVAILDALAHAHARGVVHRDIKPGNVLLAVPRDALIPAVKLTDFGIAHRLDEAPASVRSATLGTPQYMAPEQVEGALHRFGPWTDLYAVGCLAYRLASGRPPFWEEGITLIETFSRHLGAPVPPVRSESPLPASFDAWLGKMLAKQPAQRFRSAADARTALLDLGVPAAAATRAATGTPASVDEITRVDDLPIAPLPPDSSELEGSELLPTRMPPFPETWRSVEPPRRSPALAGAGLALFGLRPAPFVGRDAERDTLWRALGAVHAARRPRLVVVRGPAGVGKSRLADWLAARARETGVATVLAAFHAAALGGADGLGPMVARFLRTAGLPRDEALAVTADEVAALGGDTSDAAPLLEITHQLAAGKSNGETDAVPRVRFAVPRERHRAICRLLALLARDRPVLLHIEDAQFAPDALGLVTEVLASALPVLCLLGVSTDTLDERPAEGAALATLAAHPAADTLTLAPLDDRHHAELVEGLLRLAPDLSAEVVHRTRKDPLFAVQLVGDWVQRGILEAGDEGFVLSSGADGALPKDIHALWVRRVTRALAESSPAVASLERAAALGPVVDPDEWARAAALSGLPPPHELAAALELHGLLRREGPSWAFCHGMLVESLSRHAREAGRFEDHHRACAAALGREPLGPAIRERIACHLAAAGELSAALAPALTAALERQEGGDLAAALALLDRRESWIERLALPDADPRRVWGSLRRALVLTRMARVREAGPLLDGAEIAARTAGHGELLAEVLHARGRAATMAGRAPEGIALFEEARACFAELSDRRGVARCDEGLGELFQHSSRLAEARPRFEAALEGYAACGDRLAHAWCRMALAHLVMLTEGGDRATGLALMVEAEREFAAVGNRLGLARAAIFLGHDARILERRLDVAEAHYERALSIYDAIGSADVAVAEISLGVVHLLRGDFGRATAFLEEAHARFEAEAREGYLVFSHMLLLSCRASARDWDRFDAHCSAVETALAKTGLADDDLELGARLAEDAARRAGADARADRVGSIARAQRAALGMPEQTRPAPGE